MKRSCWNIRTQLPVLDILNFTDASCFIVEFHKALGRDPDIQELDPRKIVMHRETWDHYCQQLIKTGRT